jgi:hypothetical protein
VSGYVRLPGGLLDPWGDPAEPTPDQQEAIDEIETCRRRQDVEVTGSSMVLSVTAVLWGGR